MKHIRQLVGDFGVEKNTLTNFLRREIELNYSPNFLNLSCDEVYLAVAGTSNLKPSITIYNVEALISQVIYHNHFFYLLLTLLTLLIFRIIFLRWYVLTLQLLRVHM